MAEQPRQRLTSLRRSVELDRRAGQVRLTDTFYFLTPATAETAIVTHARVDVDAGRVRLRGERARCAIVFDSDLVVTPYTETAPLFDGENAARAQPSRVLVMPPRRGARRTR